MYYDKTNIQKISQLHPLAKEISTIFFARLAENKLDFLMTDSYRSIEEQNQLYAKGRTSKGNIVTQVNGGYSHHNYGLAFDIVPILNGKLNYSDEYSYKKASQIADSLGLEWGGDWKKFVDMPHFQYSLGLNYSNITKGMQIPSTLSKGSNGKHIKAIQKILFDKGFSITIDGYFGSNTESTLTTFQTASNLEATGKIDVATIKALFANGNTSNEISKTSINEITKTTIDIEGKVFDIESYRKNDTIYVPIRKFLTELGYTNISWDSKNNTVIIKKSFT